MCALRPHQLLVAIAFGIWQVPLAFANADLALTARVSEPAYATAPITATIVVTNLGPDYVTDVRVENQMSADASVITAAVVHSDGREFPGGCFVGTVGSLAGSVSCAVGSIASQETATITIVFTATEGQHAIRSWTFGGFDPNGDNNIVNTSFPVLPAAEIPAASGIGLWLLFLALGGVGWTRLRA